MCIRLWRSADFTMQARAAPLKLCCIAIHLSSTQASALSRLGPGLSRMQGDGVKPVLPVPGLGGLQCGPAAPHHVCEKYS